MATVRGSTGNDRLSGTSRGDDLEGRQGDDTLFGLDGSDDIHGGQGNDLADGGSGNDRLHGGVGDDTLLGGDGDDTLWGGHGANELSGGAGDDHLHGDDGAGRYWGGDGDDTMHGGAGNDSLFGENGNDLLRGGGGHDRLDGGDGDDTIHGGSGRDTLIGGAGADRLLGGHGGNVFDGGAGNDTIEAGTGADSVAGGDGNDLVRGGQGNDTIDGGDGADTISGGQGDDLLIHRPGQGGDAAIGGKGTDTLRLELSAAQWQDASVRSAVEQLNAFVGSHDNPDSAAGHGGTFTSQTLGVSVNSVERLAVVVDGVAKQPGDKLVDARDDALGEVRVGEQLTGNVTANDGAPDGIAGVTVVAAPSAGTLSMGSDGQFSYDPGASFGSLGAGEVSIQTFTYRIADPQGDTDTATASFRVVGVNDGPTAGDDAVSGVEDQPVTIAFAELLANDRDPDAHDMLTVVDAGNAEGGSVSLAAGGIVFRPDQDFSGTARFDYRVSDGHGGEATGHVVVNLAAVNDAPVANDDAVTGDEDSPRLISAADLLGNDRDPDAGDQLRIVSVGDATDGTVALTASGDVLFTPNANFHGNAGFAYTIADAGGLTSSSRVAVNVGSVNDDPVAGDDTANGYSGETIAFAPGDLLGNDSDADGDPLTVTGVGNADHGDVAIDAAGRILFTPETGFAGTASFDYRVSDGHGGSDTARVAVSVATRDKLIEGTPGQDSLVGGSGNDTIIGNAGADTIIGGAGGDLLTGGASAGDFTRTTRTELSAQGLTSEAHFGSSVDIDGNIAVVSASNQAGGAGAVYAYEWVGTSWSSARQIVPSGVASRDYFGQEGAVAVQGSTLIVGSPGDDNAKGTDAGSVYVYQKDGQGWQQTQQITASDGTNDTRFGVSVAVSGDWMIVGKGDNDAQGVYHGGSAYVFHKTGAGWVEEARLVNGAPGDLFAGKVAIDGDIAVVSSYGDDSLASNAGAVYVYRHGTSGWTFEQKLVAGGDGNPANDRFGADVAVSNGTIVVGAYADEAAGPNLSGSAYVFDYSGGHWSQTQKLVDSTPHQWAQLGYSVDIDGNRIVLGGQESEGSDRAGEVIVYERANGVWSQTSTLTQGNGQPAEYFGYSVALDGNRVVAGAILHGSGGAYLFDAGGDAGDTFVVGGSGNDTITDFEVGIDRLELQGGATIAGYRETDANNDGRIDTIADLSDGGSVTMLGVSGIAPPQTAEAIVFSSKRASGNDDLWIMRPDGTGARQMTLGPNNDFDASISPDGTKVAFTRHLAGTDYTNVWVKDLRTGAETQLTSSNMEGAPDWSPDGTQIAFHSYRAGNGHIWVMNADGGGQRQLSTATTDTMPDWGTDGYIYFQSTRDHRDLWDIWKMSPVTGSATRVIGGNQEYQPAVSDDGTKLAWADIPGISIANIDGSGAHAISIGGGGEHALPDWSPDGQWVMYQDGNHADLYKTNISTGQIVQLTNASGQDHYGEWGRVVRNPTIDDWFA
ncbi:MAG: tandem-95 repeat protein [Alphaproteobacteria bacterium]|nr:tandem-95 repeat protein [Alphaproteobacteria bacterium]